MRTLFHTVIGVFYFPLFFLYRAIVKSEKSLSDFNTYLTKLKIPYNGYVGFVLLFRHFPEYRSIAYHRHPKCAKFLSFIFKPQVHLYINTPNDGIGKNLMIWHGFSTIINANSIGSNCSIWQQVTIGNKNDEVLESPIIGDNVKICAGAILIGNIKIGNNSTIGAGSVVVKDVPDNAIVAGVPAKVVKLIN